MTQNEKFSAYLFLVVYIDQTQLIQLFPHSGGNPVVQDHGSESRPIWNSGDFKVILKSGA